MTHTLSGRFLVHGTKGEGQDDTSNNQDSDICPVLVSDVGLSFWGGIDETTGIVIDTTHPLHGQSVAGTILCLPSGRGSCTASQVMLELILNNKAPRALILRDRDGLVSMGALIAQSVFPESTVLHVLQLQGEDYNVLLDMNPSFGRLNSNGTLDLAHNSSDLPPLSTTQSSLAPSNDSEDSLSMVLSKQEEQMIQDAKSPAEERAVQCILRYARIYSDRPTYVNVEKAHIDGCTYIGPGGLQFVQRLVQDGGQVRIPTTLNSVSTDLRHWKTLGIEPTTSQQASIQLADAYVQLGCDENSFTCAPYLLQDPPQLGQQIVWGESNAVVYANSVLGARTEKYADYLDICCALVGKVPALGMHLDAPRQPTILLDASTSLNFEVDDEDAFSLLFPILGHLAGTLADGQVPILVGLEPHANRITDDHLKAFCAAFGTTGSAPLVHMAGVTPEAKENDQMVLQCTRTVTITTDHLEETYKLLDQEKTSNDTVQWVAIGNPHLSLSECERLKYLIESLPEPRRKHEDVSIVACMSRVLYDQSPAIPALLDFGVQFVQDTCWCMLLHPPMIPTNPNAQILTNSGKYAHYGPGLTGRRFRMGSMNDCVQAAVTGRLPRRTPRELPWSRSYSTLVPRPQRVLRMMILH
eukprot:Nitzschia sp. Nitz4//scaffold37_size175936//173668//175587//NITZ4_002073-RA/size175936-processed-gene-0.207-mRNA-1//1//CDS//3329549869//2778//frame0